MKELSKQDAIAYLAFAEHHLKQAHLLAIQMGIDSNAVDIRSHVFEGLVKIDEVIRGFQDELEQAN